MPDETTAATVYCERCGDKIGPTTIYVGGHRYCPRCAQDYEEREHDGKTGNERWRPQGTMMPGPEIRRTATTTWRSRQCG